jgi:Na+-transporting NADH:ubiquinone oxidoreductase subunit E
VGLGLAVVVLTALTVPLNNFLLNTVLKEGALGWLGQPEIDLTFLGLMIYIATIAAVVQILEMVLDKFVPALYNTLGIFLPLLTVNCAILGASLFMVERDYTFLESTAYGIGAGGGFMMAVILLAAIREKSEYADSPKGLRGLGMTFISAGLMAMAFMGFAGISF